MSPSVGELARVLGGELIGSPQLLVTHIAPLHEAGEHSITFISQAKWLAQLGASRAACMILADSQRAAAEQRVAAGHGAVILVNDPYLAFARLTQWWAAATRERPVPGVHATAVVEPGARVHPGAHVGALAYVGAGADVGEGCVVGAQAHLGPRAVLGAGSVLMPRSMVAFGCRLGARVLLHGGAVIGADGFGFAPDHGRWVKIEQLGAVILGDDVEIGANSCVDRGALGDTVLEEGVKLDNLVQIAHNVRVGRHTAFAGCAAVAGSTRIGAHCTIGGAARIVGHLEIVDHVHISATTLVSRSIRKPGHYSGAFPFDENAEWEKNAATLRQLHALRDRLRTLERAVGTLQGAAQHTSENKPAS